MGFWTAEEHQCKNLIFLQVQIFPYELIPLLLTLILEKVLIKEMHI
jgi:hypothetical protein